MYDHKEKQREYSPSANVNCCQSLSESVTGMSFKDALEASDRDRIVEFCDVESNALASFRSPSLQVTSLRGESYQLLL